MADQWIPMRKCVSKLNRLPALFVPALFVISCNSNPFNPAVPAPPPQHIAKQPPGAIQGPMGHSHSPGKMNERFMQPNLDTQHWDKNFGKGDRDVIKNKAAIIETLQLQPGQTVADVGAGTGAFLDDLSKAVTPSGKVYAVDISPAFVQFIQEKVEQNQLTNVTVRLGQLDSMGLPVHSVDVILVVDTYHHFDHPQAMLADFRRTLKKDGKLAIVDFAKTPNARRWIQNHIRLTPEEYIEEIEASGFKLIQRPSIPFEENFMIVFQKK